MASRPLLLLTAFDPFAGDDRNPSAEVLRAVVASGRVGPVVAEVLPVVFATAGERVEELLGVHRPVAWVGLGLHAGATAVTLERRAANADHASVPDNVGDVRRGTAIEPGGPPFRSATLPLSAMAAAGPTVFSDSAGRFVCNHTFYRAAATADRLDPRPAVGFVHLPWPCDWPGKDVSHAVTFDELVATVTALLEVVAERRPANAD